jgi:2-keto-3-deoxy-L-rhamnonate aldolase RhmA
MTPLRLVVAAAALAALVLAAGSAPQAEQASRMYNTAKVKLMSGEPIVGGTVSTPDPDIYCAMADAGYDYIWIEMQHSPLSFSEVARMIWACKDAPSIPFIRVPDSSEGAIQKATDIGALGIIVPMVSDAAKMEEAVTYAFYPPIGERSQGGGQYRALWGDDYRQTINDNLLIIAMIETVRGVENAAAIAAVDHVDVVFAASSDLGSFSGRRQGDPEYEALITTIEDATLSAGLKLGGPQAWMDREGFSFFQGPGTTSLIRLGARTSLETQRSGTAQIEGTERR